MIATSAGAYAAPAGNIKSAFGNTLLVIDPDGRSRKIWLTPDGTWTGLSRRGLDLAGRWRMDGDKVCLSQSKPALPGSLCQRFPDDLTLGGPATKAASQGRDMLKLVEGHVVK
ncbi:MAG: hypothetical protein ACYDD1_01460 [Caulobacteraceae bacterium]